MDLKDYFETTKGYGVLSTSSKEGEVNAAIYSRPHVMDDGSLGIIMNNKLSHQNVASNPKAHYLFIEEGPGHNGVRLALTRLKEEQNTELLYSLCRRCYPKELEQKDKTLFLVFFHIDRQLPLIGSEV